MENNNGQPPASPSNTDAAHARFLESMGIPASEQPAQPAPSAPTAPESVEPQQAAPEMMHTRPDSLEESGVVLSSAPDDMELPGANPGMPDAGRGFEGPMETEPPAFPTQQATSWPSPEAAPPAADVAPDPAYAAPDPGVPAVQPEMPDDSIPSGFQSSGFEAPDFPETPSQFDPVPDSPAPEFPTSEATPTDFSPAMPEFSEPTMEETSPAFAEAEAPTAPFSDHVPALSPTDEFSSFPETPTKEELPQETPAMIPLNLEALAPAPAPTPKPEPELADEPLQLHCPKCKEELILRREHLGIEGACVWCGVPIVAAESGADRQVRIFPVFQPATEPAAPSGPPADQPAAAFEDAATSGSETPTATPTDLPEPASVEEPAPDHGFSGQDNAWSGTPSLPATQEMPAPAPEAAPTEDNAAPEFAGFSGTGAYETTPPATPANEPATAFDSATDIPTAPSFPENQAEMPSQEQPTQVAPSGFDSPAAMGEPQMPAQPAPEPDAGFGMPNESANQPATAPSGFDSSATIGEPQMPAQPAPEPDAGFGMPNEAANPVEVAEVPQEEIPSAVDAGFASTNPPTEANPEDVAAAMNNGFGAPTSQPVPIDEIPSAPFDAASSPAPAGAEMNESAPPAMAPNDGGAEPMPGGFATASEAPAPPAQVPWDTPTAAVPESPAPMSENPAPSAPMGFGEVINSPEPGQNAADNTPNGDIAEPSSFFNATSAPQPDPAAQQPAAGFGSPAANDAPQGNPAEMIAPASAPSGFAIPQAGQPEGPVFESSNQPESQASGQPEMTNAFPESPAMAPAAPQPGEAAAPGFGQTAAEAVPASWGESMPLPTSDSNNPVNEAPSENADATPEKTPPPLPGGEPLLEETLPAPQMEQSQFPAGAANAGNGLFAPAAAPPQTPHAEEGDAGSEAPGGNVQKSPIGEITAPAPGKSSRKGPRKGLIVFLVILIGFVSGAAAVSFFLPIEEYILKAQAFVESTINPTAQGTTPTLPSLDATATTPAPAGAPAAAPSLPPTNSASAPVPPAAGN